METATKEFARGPREFTYQFMQLLPSLSRAERRGNLFGDFVQRLNEIRFLGVIEVDAQSASFFPKRHVRPLSERH